MKTKLVLGFVILCLAGCGHNSVNKGGLDTLETGLAQALEKDFFVGAALAPNHYDGSDLANRNIATKHFNAIVAENVMKSMFLQPKKGKFFWDDADAFVAFGEMHNMHITGHTLAWHSQTPGWLFVDDQGVQVSREVLLNRMETHIKTVVTRYKGRVDSWDVVNEAVLDNGEMRDSPFYKIIGPDWVEHMFRFAHEADPNVALLYNDYSLAIPEKREAVYALVKGMQAKGIRVDGIGLQQHMGLNNPTIAEIETSILRFAELGDVLVTELDISVLPWPGTEVSAEVSQSYEFRKEMDPYPNGLPANVSRQLDERYLSLFKLYRKHSDKITRVTTWGIGDAHTWRNNWPVEGRTDYPLLFNRDNTPKPVVGQIIDMARD